MQFQVNIRFVRIGVEVLNSLGIKTTRAPDNSVDLVTFTQQKFGQIATVLPREIGRASCRERV